MKLVVNNIYRQLHVLQARGNLLAVWRTAGQQIHISVGLFFFLLPVLFMLCNLGVHYHILATCSSMYMSSSVHSTREHLDA